MSDQLKIFIAFHKPFYCPALDFIVPVWAGKNGRKDDMKIQGDDTGDNISSLNEYFSELTVIYWAWKNNDFAPDDIWGLCHYRRYFAAPFRGLFARGKEKLTRYPSKKEIDAYVNIGLKTAILKRIQTADVIIPSPMNASLRRRIIISIEDKYVESHSAGEWKIMKEVLLEKYPEYLSSFEVFSKETKMSIGNMMIARTATWDHYLMWLFDILMEVSQRLSRSKDPYQKRSEGFMAERLMNLYIRHHQLKTEYLPIVIFDKK